MLGLQLLGSAFGDFLKRIADRGLFFVYLIVKQILL